MTPPINHLNPPPNPFWDFVADMQNHPFFAAYPPPQNQNQPREEGTATAEAGPSNTTAGEQKQPQQQQTNIDDPPEVDPETLAEEPRGQRREGCRGRRRRGSNSDEEGEHHRRGGPGRRGWGGPWGHRAWRGPMGPPGGFPFGGQPDLPPWARPHGDSEQHSPPSPPQFGPFGPGHGPSGPPHMGPFNPGQGPFGRGGIHRRGGPHSHHHDHDHHHGALPHRRGPGGPGGPRGPRGPDHHRGPSPHHHRRGPSPPGFGPPGPHGGFDLSKFLNDLGARIGVDLTGAAENLGLDKFMPGAQNSAEVDFEPKADIFSAPTKYTIHISLPGAKKSDVGVDWDGEQSSLHVAGVVHRPEVDEAMLSQLVVDGRKRETGVFEKTIRLGTRHEPAIVDVAGIKARMVDGVLIVTVPKLERRNEKRDVSISKSETPSPVREVCQSQTNEKDHEMTDLLHEDEEGEIRLIDRTQFEQSKKEVEKGKEAEHHEAEKMTRERSATVEAETRAEVEAGHDIEPLPVYANIDAAVERQEGHGSDWENFGSDDEGEYVKINVD